MTYMTGLFGVRDLILVIGVSALVTVIAFVHRPRLKVLLQSIPLPFTLANLSLNAQVGVSHAAGMLMVILYFNLVRWLHYRARWHIVPSIACAATVYAAVGAVMNRLLPESGTAFWVTVAVAVIVAVGIRSVFPHRPEPGHRSELPIPVKATAVTGVIGIIVVLKRVLGGYMTTFPMAGVVGAYEMRKSLWALCRQGPVIVLSIEAMIVIMRLLQQHAGFSVALSLPPAWLGWAAVIVPFTVYRRRMEDAYDRASADAGDLP